MLYPYSKKGILCFALTIIPSLSYVVYPTFSFADDTSILHCAVSIINKYIEAMYDWYKQWFAMVNPTQTVYILLSSKISPSHVPRIFFGKIHLGVFKKNKYILSRNSLEIGYFSFMNPNLEYDDFIDDSFSKSDSDKLANVQLESAWIATGCKSHTSHRQLYSELGWIKLSDCRKSNKIKNLYCITRFKTPQYLIETLEEMKIYHSHSTRSALTQSNPMPKCKNEITKK